MVGIMRAGGAYVPLDPQLPEARLQSLVEQCRCEVVVALQKFESLARQLSMAEMQVVVAEEVMATRVATAAGTRRTLCTNTSNRVFPEPMRRRTRTPRM